MEPMNWCKDVMDNEVTQNTLEKKVQLLLDGPLNDKSDYAKEKCIKSFYELPMYIEQSLLKKAGLSPDSIKGMYNGMISGELSSHELLNKYNAVNKAVISEIERQYRHFTAFL